VARPPTRRRARAILEYLDFQPVEAILVRGALAAAARRTNILKLEVGKSSGPSSRYPTFFTVVSHARGDGSFRRGREMCTSRRSAVEREVAEMQNARAKAPPAGLKAGGSIWHLRTERRVRTHGRCFRTGARRAPDCYNFRVATLLPYLVVAAIVTAVIAWSWQFHFWSPRSRNRLWFGFSATGMSALFLIAGLIGWDLNRHKRFVTGITRTGDVIWWQVAVGLVILPLAVYLLRRGVRDISMKSGRQVRS
jgi:hypothetical protein